jgi:starch-binding outer membrane protein, SusD/RagB family
MTSTNSTSRLATIRRAALVLALPLAATACDLDLENPNAPTEQQTIGDIEGLISTAVGMQAQFANNVNAWVRAPAMVSDEWGARTASLAADQSLVIGTVDASFGVVAGPFNGTYRVMRSADLLIANVPGSGLGPGFQAGMVSLAHLYRAMALGMAIQQFERIPDRVDPAGAPLESRERILQVILGDLQQARQVLQGASDLGGFNTRVVTAQFNLRNTIDAMTARYALLAGDYAGAIEAAARVDAGVISRIVYPDPATNPIYNYHFELNYVAARQSFVDDAEEGDQRPAFWVDVDGTPPGSAFGDIPLRPIRQYAARNAEFPLYLPGEMQLIRAESHARLGQLAEARELINAVRTRCDTSPASQPAACLPALSEADLPDQAAILRQIAYERRYELFMQGMRWEDLRRFGADAGPAPSIQWLPIPQQECDANPQISC